MMVEIELDHDQVSEIVRQDLLSSLEVIEFLAQPEDIELWPAMLKVIEYYSTPDQWEELNARGCHENWESMALKFASEGKED